MSKGVKIFKPKPLYRRKLRRAPGAPLGDRILVLADPPEDVSEGGLVIPDTAKTTCMKGRLLAVGDQAAEKIYELGAELGDEVWYAKYAGCIEEWQHLVGKDNADCDHDGAWDTVPVDDEKAWAQTGGPHMNISLRSCRSCGTLKATEKAVVMNVEDILLDVDIQERFESGALIRRRTVDSEGRTRYVVERTSGEDSFEIKRSK